MSETIRVYQERKRGVLLHFMREDSLQTLCGFDVEDLNAVFERPASWAGLWCTACLTLNREVDGAS